LTAVAALELGRGEAVRGPGSSGNGFARFLTREQIFDAYGSFDGMRGKDALQGLVDGWIRPSALTEITPVGMLSRNGFGEPAARFEFRGCCSSS